MAMNPNDLTFVCDLVRRRSGIDLDSAKEYLVGSFALRIDSNAKLLANLANIAWYGLPLDYLDTWTRHVKEVTAAQIKAAFARKLQPDRMVTVVVGAQTAPKPQ